MMKETNDVSPTMKIVKLKAFSKVLAYANSKNIVLTHKQIVLTSQSIQCLKKKYLYVDSLQANRNIGPSNLNV